jgi:lysozyme family protein
MSFNEALSKTLQYEGGYVNNPADSGGETNYGITVAVARANGYTGDMKDLTVAFAGRIYKSKYWDINKLDAIDAMHARLAAEIFDYGVNAGPVTAAKALQEALNLLNENGKLFTELTVNGAISGDTLNAIKILDDKNRGDDICLAVKALRAEKYINICRKNASQEVFIRGWLRRVFQ